MSQQDLKRKGKKLSAPQSKVKRPGLTSARNLFLREFFKTAVDRATAEWEAMEVSEKNTITVQAGRRDGFTYFKSTKYPSTELMKQSNEAWKGESAASRQRFVTMAEEINTSKGFTNKKTSVDRDDAGDEVTTADDEVTTADEINTSKGTTNNKTLGDHDDVDVACDDVEDACDDVDVASVLTNPNFFS